MALTAAHIHAVTAASQAIREALAQAKGEQKAELTKAQANIRKVVAAVLAAAAKA